MKDLNVRQETIKLLLEKTGNKVFDLSCSNYLLDMTPEAREIEIIMNCRDPTKIKIFCKAKETTN